VHGLALVTNAFSVPVTRVASALGVAAFLACSRDPAPASPPAPPEGAPAPPAVEASRFNVPLEYDFTPVLRIVERVVPSTFGSLDSVHVVPDDDRRHYAFEASRGPFTAFAAGNQVHLRTTIAYKARGFYKPLIGPTISAGCGNEKEQPRITVEMATPVSLSANWHLVSKARVVSVAAASAEQRDHCDVTIFHKDVTQSVINAAQSALTSHLADIDRMVGRVSLTEHATGWWKTLATPIQLTNGVWLLLGPEALSIGSVGGRSKTLIVPVSLSAHPRIVASTTEPDTPDPALPSLGRDSASGGFHIALEAKVDYGIASRELTNALSSKVIALKGHSIRLVRASVLPQPAGRLALSLTFAGDARGTLMLNGTPKLDLANGIVSVPDLSFDLKTENQLLKTYSWLRSDVLTTELRKRARIPTVDALREGRSLLTQGLNRKIGSALSLSGTVQSVAFRDLFVTRDGLLVRADATGRAGVSVRQ
jgi:hypothetical protein